jgi:cobalt-zinc-cadmium efflux system outer membrane protein
MKTQSAFIRALLLLVIPGFLAHADEAKDGLVAKKNPGLTLPEVVATFTQSNPHVKILEGRLAATRAELRQSQLLPNPEVIWRVEDSVDRDNFVEASWPVDISGRRWLKSKAARAGIVSAERLYQWELNSLLADVKTRYYEVVACQERLRIAEDGASRYASILNNLRGRAGQTDFDRLLLERELAEVRADAAEAERELHRLHIEFAVLLNEDPHAFRLAADLKPARALPDRKTLEGSILSDHPKVVSALKAVERRDLERKAARRKWIPEITVSGGFKNTSGDDVNKTGFAGEISFAIPIFDAGQEDLAAAKGELKAAESEAVIAKTEVMRRFVETYEDAVLVTNAAREYETALLTADRVEQMAGLAYLEGRLGTLELLDAYSGAIRTRTRHTTLMLESSILEIELERIIGHPIDS